MNRGEAISNRRIIPRAVNVPPAAGSSPPSAPQRTARASVSDAAASEPEAAPTGELGARVATADDLPWIQTWAAQLGLPAPRSRRVKSFVLLRDDARVGYMAVREDMIETERGREPILWIVSAFLIPALRGQGMILRFGEILSRQFYPKGNVGCRVAADNTQMLRLVSRGGWKKLHSTRRYSDFLLELEGPFRATRRG